MALVGRTKSEYKERWQNINKMLKAHASALLKEGVQVSDQDLVVARRIIARGIGSSTPPQEVLFSLTGKIMGELSHTQQHPRKEELITSQQHHKRGSGTSDPTLTASSSRVSKEPTKLSLESTKSELTITRKTTNCKESSSLDAKGGGRDWSAQYKNDHVTKDKEGWPA